MFFRYKKDKTVSANASSSLNFKTLLSNQEDSYRNMSKRKHAVIYSVISYIRKSTVYSLLHGEK